MRIERLWGWHPFAFTLPHLGPICLMLYVQCETGIWFSGPLYVVWVLFYTVDIIVLAIGCLLIIGLGFESLHDTQGHTGYTCWQEIWIFIASTATSEGWVASSTQHNLHVFMSSILKRKLIKEKQMSCGDLNENGPHRLNIFESLITSRWTIWERLDSVVWLKVECRWEWVLRFQRPHTIPRAPPWLLLCVVPLFHRHGL